MRNSLSFLFARLSGSEQVFRNYSCSQQEVLTELAGKTVAVVGNARKMAQETDGPAIDGADLVIRINRAPMPAASSHGLRTDWLGLATSLDANSLARIRPNRILWMSHKRKRLKHAIATSPGFYLHPLDDWRALSATLNAPPSTGIMLIDLVARSDASQVRLYGFDFFASKSLSGHRSAQQVPHDFDAERQFVEKLVASDPRFQISD